VIFGEIMKNPALKHLILPVIAIASVAAIACSSGDGSESIVDTSPIATAPASAAQIEADSSTTFASTEAAAPEIVSDGLPPARVIIDSLTAEQIVEAEEQVIADVYEDVIDSTVQIIVFSEGGPNSLLGNSFRGPDDGLTPEGSGSGFVWDSEGRIVTNHHVVAGADAVRVLFPDGTNVEAEILGTDPDSDLAVLQVNLPADYLKPIELGDSDDLRPGEIALAIGAPFGRDFTLTRGVISALGRTIESPRQNYSIPNAVQTDASINPGNSGGPLLDRQGRVIGINSQIETRSGVNSGIGFAVPINQAKRVVPAIIANGEYRYSWLGVTVGTLGLEGAERLGLSSNTRGAILNSLIPGGPAENSGLESGDVVTAIDGTAIQDFADLLAYLSSRTSPGDVVTADVIRDGEAIQIEVELGTRPSTG
jgi:2-alkenal reductase